MLPSDAGDLDDNLSSLPHYFCGDIDDAAAKGRCVRLSELWKYVFYDILLEALEEEERYNHAVIVGCIRSEPLERKLLCSEVFQSSMREFICASIMVTLDNGTSIVELFLLRCGAMLKDFSVSSEIGDDHVVWA